MCEYCDKEKTIFSIEFIDTWIWAWCHGKPKTLKEAEEHQAKRDVFIDRGYLRLADPDDSQCMDHGEKIKIEYCPLCGSKLNETTFKGESA